MPSYQEIDAAELQRMLSENRDIELIDVRTPAEIRRGVLPNATALPMHMVPLRLSHFGSPPRLYVIYCRTGSRSAQVCRFLFQQGIENVANLRGGVVRWASSGHPLDPGPGSTVA